MDAGPAWPLTSYMALHLSFHSLILPLVTAFLLLTNEGAGYGLPLALAGRRTWRMVLSTAWGRREGQKAGWGLGGPAQLRGALGNRMVVVFAEMGH